MMLPTKFCFIWPGGFRGEDCFNSSQSEKRIALGGHAQAILVFDWLISKKSSPLKPLSQMNFGS
jgi:hypothetical protein